LTKKDTQLSNEEEFIKVTTEDYSIKFDRKFSYGRGHLLGVDMTPKAKTKPEADTMFENLIIKNTIGKDEGMHKEYDNVGIGEKETTHPEVMKEDFGKQIAGRVVQVPAAPNIGVVKPQEVMKYIKYIKDFDLNTKPKIKGENECYRDKKFKDGVTKLGKKTVLIEDDLEKMEIFLKHTNKSLGRVDQEDQDSLNG